MRILHCADIHLDSVMSTHLDKSKARIRRAELLGGFRRMVDYAENHGVEAILIAGDLFDTAKVTISTAQEVYHIIAKAKNIDFYYLQGNHDQGSFLSGLEEIPDNLYTFGQQVTYYERCFSETASNRKLVIAGVEMDAQNSKSFCDGVVFQSRNINILMLHGQTSEAKNVNNKHKTWEIPFRELKNRNIDYLALGHIHKYKLEALDHRGMLCYPGCLEARGFDETGEHGFVILDISESTGEVTTTFVVQEGRRAFVVYVNVSECENTSDVEKAIEQKLCELTKMNAENESEIAENDFVEIVLEGGFSVESHIDFLYLENVYENRFFMFKIKDNTSFKMDDLSFQGDISLKGEFIRTVMQDTSLSESEKARIIRYGVAALRGEDI